MDALFANPNIMALLAGGVAALIACFAFIAREDGKKAGERKGVEIGKQQAVTEVKAQQTEQTLERVVDANEARAAVRNTSDDELSEQAREDPNNRLRRM